ncbi:MAG TPA: beta-ketoacyl-ACP synthase 3 [Thermoleophilaceae bacterium]
MPRRPPEAGLATLTAEPAAARSVRGAAVVSLGVALPAGVVSNEPIAERLGVDDDWIVKRVGVRERRHLRPGERLEDLAVQAARNALADACLEPDDLDLILVGTLSQDEIAPNSAPLVAGSLGASRAGAMDVGAACMGFVAGIALAAGSIEAGRADTVLVVGADAISRFLDPDDRRTAALMADGAGAVVMTATDPPGKIGPCVLRADDSGREAVVIPGDTRTLFMEGQTTFVSAVECLSRVTRQAIAAAGVTFDDIDLFAYHQANARITKAVGEKLDLPLERVVDCVETIGNTSAASIPLALDAARRDGRLRDGTKVLMAAIGAGFNWGATVIEWGPDDR